MSNRLPRREVYDQFMRGVSMRDLAELYKVPIDKIEDSIRSLVARLEAEIRQGRGV